VVTASEFSLDAGVLRANLEKTFAGRQTHLLPSVLPPPPQPWARPYGQLAEQVGITLELASGYELAQSLINPILEGRCTGVWNVRLGQWELSP